MSNSQLMDAFASSAALDDRTTKAVRGQIVWRDGLGDDTRPCLLTLGSGDVSGGRLGRDHTLDDVPNHFLRDCLLDYIETVLEEKLRHKVRKAVFPDLTVAQLKEYGDELAQAKADDAEEERQARAAPRRRQPKKELPSTGGIGWEARVQQRVQQQAAALMAVDDTIPLTPCPGFALHRQFSDHTQGSVIIPDSEPLPGEAELDVGTDIDRNCDQIRALIKIFLREEAGWDIDQFRRALDRDGRYGSNPISRQRMTEFLEKRGPGDGKRCGVFAYAWEFFRKRELLGLPLVPVRVRTALQEVSRNGRGRKRRGADVSDKPAPAKRTKLA